MVRALLDGRKTQTRRIIKPQPEPCDHTPWAPGAGEFQPSIDGDGLHCAQCGNGVHFARTKSGVRGIPIRFAKGDKLWVRETWAPLDALTHNDPGTTALMDHGFYKADDSTVEGSIGRWKPGIHMPRWASRLTLTVIDVRVQRLQAISRTDAVAEGIERRMVMCADGVMRALWFGVAHAGNDADPVRAYADLWDAINNPRGLCAEDEPKGWAANPWVVAVSFTVERRNIDAKSFTDG